MNYVRIFAVAAFVSAWMAADGQYKAVLLHSELVPGIWSFGVGIGDGQQVGHTGPGLNSRALLWNGSAQSLINLNPDGYAGSAALGVQGGKQVGNAFHAGLNQIHPLIWNGSANDYINLFVPQLGGFSFRDNHVLGIGGNQQVGSADTGGTDNQVLAVVWQGSAQSAQLFHPEHLGVFWSEAMATDGIQQVGWGLSTTAMRGILWNGTPESAVDLSPVGAQNVLVRDVANGQQVGHLHFGSRHKAALWFGSAESFINLNPVEGGSSFAYGTNGKQQVGNYSIGPFNELEAVVWSGSAESFHNLHQYLLTKWGATSSAAHGIDEFGNIIGTITVPGLGERAVMWVVPEPGTISVLAAGSALILARRRRQV